MRSVRARLMLGCFVVGLGLAILGMQLDARVRAYLAGPPLGGSRLYAAPSMLRVDAPAPGGSLPRKLTRLGYRQATDPRAVLAPGEFRAEAATIELAQRPSPIPWAERPHRARVVVRGSRVTEL